MNEFELIDGIVDVLGDTAKAPWVTLGPGDDAAVVATPANCETVSSIDTLVEGVHFPAGAPAELIAYRSMMVSLSDLAAMAATPGYVLVAANLPERIDANWVEDFARGLQTASARYQAPVVGGNLAKGPLSLSISVHGFVPAGRALTRGTARPGDKICVTGPLGGAAAALAAGCLMDVDSLATLDGAAKAYWAPELRFDLVELLRDSASACIDVSDGLLQDLSHIARASRVGMSLASEAIPLAADASLQQALGGGDDYVLCFTTASAQLAGAHHVIGEVNDSGDLTLDGAPVHARGYNHFA